MVIKYIIMRSLKLIEQNIDSKACIYVVMLNVNLQIIKKEKCSSLKSYLSTAHYTYIAGDSDLLSNLLNITAVFLTKFMTFEHW